MSTFDYMTPGEAMNAARDDAPQYLSIIGAPGVDADKVAHIRVDRTAAGYLRKPEPTGREHAYLDKFKEIARVERARDADPGTVEVFYTDGTTDLITKYDLLCVERKIGA